MQECAVLLGSNIEPARNIRIGATLLGEKLAIQRVSSVWETLPIGTEGAKFYNAAVVVQTSLDEESLKFQILRPIEERMGRVRTKNKYAPRTMDLDAIILGSLVLDPRLWDTAFILLPIAELFPNLIHAASGNNLQNLAKAVESASGAHRVPDFPLIEAA